MKRKPFQRSTVYNADVVNKQQSVNSNCRFVLPSKSNTQVIPLANPTV